MTIDSDGGEPASVHPSAVIDEGAVIGADTRVWHFAHVMGGARIGKGCVIGHGCFIGNVVIGDGVRIQNHVSVFDGVTLEDDVFVGPSCTFTNVKRPRAAISQKHAFAPTVIRRGATLGAGVTVVCGVTIGEHAMVAAGAVVTRDVPAHALLAGVPGRVHGFVCACGASLDDGARGAATCPACAPSDPR